MMLHPTPTHLWILAAMAVTVAGCTPPPPAQEPVSQILDAKDPQAVHTAAVNVLASLNFDVERPPRSPDRVDTRPMVSAYPGEFWRKDIQTRYDRTESALHTVRRTVTVHINAPRADSAGEIGKRSVGSLGSPGKVTVRIVVRKERLHLSEAPRATTVSESYSVFSNKKRALKNFEDHWGEGTEWEDLGRDPALEQYILAQLQQRL
jgi:hypothetical protein